MLIAYFVSSLPRYIKHTVVDVVVFIIKFKPTNHQYFLTFVLSTFKVDRYITFYVYTTPWKGQTF